MTKYVKFREGGTGWVVIENDDIYYKHHKGKAPFARDLILLFLSDKDIRKMIRKYQNKGRKEKYRLYRRTGMSGCEDYYIIFAEYFGHSWHEMRRKHLIHISCCNKINEQMRPMYIGDFAELAAWLLDCYDTSSDLSRKELFRLSKAKYIKEREPKFDEYDAYVSCLV